MSTLCYRCSHKIEIAEKVSRRDCCPSCTVSIHACRFCTFYEPKAYNGCREPSADRVVDKEKENFCDFFRLRSDSPTGAQGDTTQEPSIADLAKKKLDDLFK